MKFEMPEMEIIVFESEDMVTLSSDYRGVDFEDLI